MSQVSSALSVLQTTPMPAVKNTIKEVDLLGIAFYGSCVLPY